MFLWDDKGDGGKKGNVGGDMLVKQIMVVMLVVCSVVPAWGQIVALMNGTNKECRFVVHYNPQRRETYTRGTMMLPPHPDGVTVRENLGFNFDPQGKSIRAIEVVGCCTTEVDRSKTTELTRAIFTGHSIELS